MPLSNLRQIKWKLTLVILCTSTVVLVLGTAAVLYYDAAASKKHLISEVESMAQITGASSSAALAFQNARDAMHTIAVLRSRPEIDYVCLCQSDGKPFVHFGLEGQEIDSVISRTTPEGHRIVDGKLILRRRILLGEELVGWIVIQANLERETARYQTFLQISLLSLAGLIGVALLLATRLQRLVSHPISQLASAARHITQHKDYSVRVWNESVDEIGSLVKSFNQMLAEIERQNRGLVESQQQLQLALSASQMGTWEWDIRANRVSWSVENEHLFGVPPDAMTLDSFIAPLHRDDREPVCAEFKKAVESGDAFEVEYRIASAAGRDVWVAHHGQVRRNSDGKPMVLTGIIQDISSRKRVEAERQQLIARLLHAEEEERRRIARELHDTTAQQLAFVKLGLTVPQDRVSKQLDPKAVSECCTLLDQAMGDIRTLTYMLHPPLLDEFGLADALKEFAAGATRRSSVHISVHTDTYQGRLHRNVELTLFRVVQESVTNAIRHSGTQEIMIRLARDEEEVRIEVQDFGCGLPGPPPKTNTRFLRNVGVGMAAMLERMTLIGGRLVVESDSEGVTVLASAPVAEAAPERSSHISKPT